MMLAYQVLSHFKAHDWVYLKPERNLDKQKADIRDSHSQTRGYIATQIVMVKKPSSAIAKEGK